MAEQNEKRTETWQRFLDELVMDRSVVDELRCLFGFAFTTNKDQFSQMEA